MPQAQGESCAFELSMEQKIIDNNNNNKNDVCDTDVSVTLLMKRSQIRSMFSRSRCWGLRATMTWWASRNLKRRWFSSMRTILILMSVKLLRLFQCHSSSKVSFCVFVFLSQFSNDVEFFVIFHFSIFDIPVWSIFEFLQLIIIARSVRKE